MPLFLSVKAFWVFQLSGLDRCQLNRILRGHLSYWYFLWSPELSSALVGAFLFGLVSSWGPAWHGEDNWELTSTCSSYSNICHPLICWFCTNLNQFQNILLFESTAHSKDDLDDSLQLMMHKATLSEAHREKKEQRRKVQEVGFSCFCC